MACRALSSAPRKPAFLKSVAMKRDVHYMLRGAVVFCASLSAQLRGGSYQVDTTCKSTVVGRLDVLPLTSKIFANTRNLRIWLPPGYGEASQLTKKYPVLYMLDGQNLFDVCTAVGAIDEWHVDETMTSLIQGHSIKPVIVVGIDSLGEQERMHEYLPYKDIPVFPTMAEPAGKQFPEFLGTEVLPLIEAHYRAEAGPKHTAIGGSSLRGGRSVIHLANAPGSVWARHSGKSGIAGRQRTAFAGHNVPARWSWKRYF